MATKSYQPVAFTAAKFFRVMCRFTMLILASMAVGCAQTVHDLGAAGASGAVPAAITELRRPQNQQALAEVAGSQPAQQASWAVGVGLGHGMVDEGVAIVTGQSLPIDGTTRPAIALPSNSAVADYLKQNVEPAMTAIVRSCVRQAMDEALSPESQLKAQRMAESLGDGTATGITRAVERDTLPMIKRLSSDQIGPAMNEAMSHFRPALREWIHQDIGPEVKQVLDDAAADALKIPTRPDIAPAVVANARNLSVGGSYGAHDAAIDLGFLAKNGGPTAGAKLLLTGVVVVLILIGLGAAAFLVVLTLIAIQLRQYRPTDPAKSGS